MPRRLFLSLPAVAAAIVVWAVLGGSDPRVRYVQVLGGPTRSGQGLSVLLRALALDDERRVPLAGLAVSGLARSGSSSVRQGGVTDASGHLELSFDLGATGASDPWLRIESTEAGQVLAEGRLGLDVESWRADARQDGGWLVGQASGVLDVRVAIVAGVLAVPFDGELALQVRESRDAGAVPGSDDGAPVADAIASVECDGAELTEGAVPATDATGQTRIRLRPLEHAISARVVVRAGERSGEWYGALPVIPGASIAQLSEGELELRSPILRERAFVSLVSARERIAGAIVPLAPEPDGSARGQWPLTPALRARLDVEPLWAVVSSEDDKRSGGVVGWPLQTGFDPRAPAMTFGVPDRVLLDGQNGALYDVAQAERARRQIAAVGLLGVGLTMCLGLAREVRRGRPAAATSASGAAGEGPALAPGGGWLAVALGCIAIGLGLLAYFGLLAPR